MTPKTFMTSATVAPISLFAQRQRAKMQQYQRKRISTAPPTQGTSAAAANRWSWSGFVESVADAASRSESDDGAAIAPEEDGDEDGCVDDHRPREAESAQTQSQPPIKRRRRNNVTATVSEIHGLFVLEQFALSKFGASL